MKVLITGTAGFIGFFLAEQLLKAGYEVIGVDNINDYYDVNLKYSRLEFSGVDGRNLAHNVACSSSKYDKYTFYKADLADKDFILDLFQREKFDYVVNLAAQAGVRYSIQNPYAYVQSNIVGYLNLLEGCRWSGVKHFVYASSSSVYGLNESMPFSVKDNVDHPVSLYAATKKSNELMAHTYSHLYNIPTSGLRFFTVYGPWGRPDMAYFLFANAIIKDDPIKVFNHGKMMRDFTYIDDIVNGIVNVMELPATAEAEWSGKNPDPSRSKAPYRIYNIGNNQPVELMTFIKEIEANFGKEAKKEFMNIQDGDVPATWANVDDLIENFDYRPSTTIQVGIKEFANWYKTFYFTD